MRPIEFVYKAHPWRKARKSSEAGFILGQFLEEFHSHDFIRVYRQHLAAGGREGINDKALHAKLWYHFQQGYLIRRGYWGGDWKEWQNGREVDVLIPAGNSEVKQKEQAIDQMIASIPEKEERVVEPEVAGTDDVLKDLGFL